MIDVFGLHGIGKSFPPSYYDDAVKGVQAYLKPATDVKFHGIDYSHLLESREDVIYSWLKDIDPWYDPFSKKARKFATDYICDVLAYAYPRRPPQLGDFIYDMTKLLTDKVADIRLGASIVFVGHSLGSIVAYGATWDIKTDCLITMGSPFNYFSIRYKDFGEMNPDLPQFHNFWRGRDWISTVISKNPNFRNVHDYEVTSRNPLNLSLLNSHGIYWKSDFVHKKIASILNNLEEKR